MQEKRGAHSIGNLKITISKKITFPVNIFLEILIFGIPIEWARVFPASLKPPTIDSTHRELFKNPKIIEIGSQKQKLQHFKVG